MLGIVSTFNSSPLVGGYPQKEEYQGGWTVFASGHMYIYQFFTLNMTFCYIQMTIQIMPFLNRLTIQKKKCWEGWIVLGLCSYVHLGPHYKWSFITFCLSRSSDELLYQIDSVENNTSYFYDCWCFWRHSCDIRQVFTYTVHSVTSFLWLHLINISGQKWPTENFLCNNLSSNLL